MRGGGVRLRGAARTSEDRGRRLERALKLTARLKRDLQRSEDERDALRERCARLPLEITARNELWLAQVERLQGMREEARRQAEERSAFLAQELGSKDRELARVGEFLQKLLHPSGGGKA